MLASLSGAGRSVLALSGGRAVARRCGENSGDTSGRDPLGVRSNSMAIALLAAAREHADSVVALRIVFCIGLGIVFFAGIYFLRNRRRFFDRDPEVTGDHYGARNLRLWR